MFGYGLLNPHKQLEALKLAALHRALTTARFVNNQVGFGHPKGALNPGVLAQLTDPIFGMSHSLAQGHLPSMANTTQTLALAAPLKASSYMQKMPMRPLPMRPMPRPLPPPQSRVMAGFWPR